MVAALPELAGLLPSSDLDTLVGSPLIANPQEEVKATTESTSIELQPLQWGGWTLEAAVRYLSAAMQGGSRAEVFHGFSLPSAGTQTIPILIFNRTVTTTGTTEGNNETTTTDITAPTVGQGMGSAFLAVLSTLHNSDASSVPFSVALGHRFCEGSSGSTDFNVYCPQSLGYAGATAELNLLARTGLSVLDEFERTWLSTVNMFPPQEEEEAVRLWC